MQVYSISFFFLSLSCFLLLMVFQHLYRCSFSFVLFSCFLKGCIVRFGPRLRQFASLRVCAGSAPRRVAVCPCVVGPVDGGRLSDRHVLHAEEGRAFSMPQVPHLLLLLPLPLAVRQAALGAVVPGLLGALGNVSVDSRPPAPATSTAAFLGPLAGRHVLLRGLVVLVVHKAVGA